MKTTRILASLLTLALLTPSIIVAAMTTAQEVVFTENLTFDSHTPGSGPGGCDESSNFNLIGAKWRKFPVKYQVDVSNAPSDVRGAATGQIELGFEAWEGITGISNFFQRVSKSGNKVQFAFIDGPGAVLAQVQLFGSFPGGITKFTMTFDSGDNWEIFGADVCPTPDGRTGFDIQETAAHEAGHVVGLDHADQCATCSNRALTLYPFIFDEGETYKRSPALGDRLGMKAVYP